MQALQLVDLPKLRAHLRSARTQKQLREAGELPDILPADVLPAGAIDPGELE